MIQNVLIRTEHLQAELIISDIPYSGKAYLRAITGRIEPDRPPGDENRQATAMSRAAAESRTTATPSLSGEIDDLLNQARNLALAQHGRILLAGFRPDGLLGLPSPEKPPAGLVHYTDFVLLTAVTAEVSSRAEVLSLPFRSRSVACKSGEIPEIQRVPLTDDRIRTYIDLHEAAMQGVPNVPQLTEEEVREQLPAGNLYILEQTGGAAVGFYERSVDPVNQTASLEEIGILPEWRNCGIGRMVIGVLAAELAAANISKLTVLVATVNEAALRLYRRLGFGQEQLFSRWFRQQLPGPADGSII